MSETGSRLLNPEQKQELQRDFKGVWIPKEVWLDENLSALDKIILVEINSLDNSKGCYASNEYLAKFCQCSKQTVVNSISKLKKLGYIEQISFDGRTRVLISRLLNFNRQTIKKSEADHKNLIGYNNNIENNINNNIISKPSKPVARKKNSLQVFSNAVLKYFELGVKTDSQKEVWFRRNCRNLKDILAYCNEDIEIAMFVISETCRWLKDNNLSGGYEAVCRNLPEMYSKAMKRLEKGERWDFSDELNEQIQSVKQNSLKKNTQISKQNRQAILKGFEKIGEQNE